MQGPCAANQYCIAIETSALDVCRRVLSRKLAKRGSNTRLSVARVRGAAAKLLSALVEGGDEPLVNARIVDKIGWECVSTLLINLHDRLEQLLALRRRAERAATRQKRRCILALLVGTLATGLLCTAGLYLNGLN